MLRSYRIKKVWEKIRKKPRTCIEGLGDGIERIPCLLEHALVRVHEEEDEGADELWHVLVVVHLRLLAERVQQRHSSTPEGW